MQQQEAAPNTEQLLLGSTGVLHGPFPWTLKELEGLAPGLLDLCSPKEEKAPLGSVRGTALAGKLMEVKVKEIYKNVIYIFG